MISLHEAYKAAANLAKQEKSSPVPGYGRFTDSYVLFPPFNIEWEGCPSYIVDRDSGAVRSISVHDGPEFDAIWYSSESQPFDLGILPVREP